MRHPARSESMATKASAAGLLRMSRPTLYRYLARYTKAREKTPTLPEVIDSSGKVNLDVLFEFVSWRKARDKRGFPLGQKRLQAQTRFEVLKDADGKRFWALLPRRQSQTFGRSFEKRMELIKREIDAMTDYDQSILVTQGPKMLLDMLRPEPHEIASNYDKLRATLAAGKRPKVITLPPRPRR